MVRDLKVMTLGNPLLERLEGLVLEFNNLSAIETDQMVVVASF
jgi:DNA-binding IclR family transcriptional regulator